MYVVPKSDDRGYYEEEAEKCPPSSLPDLKHVVAQPLMAGGMLTFSHRLLHWGSPPDQHRTVLDDDLVAGRVPRPRIALTFAMADPSFEQAYFEEKYLPLPPLALRMGLVAGQQVQYEHLEPLTKHQVAFYRRVFHSQKDYFAAPYFDKISSAVQFMAYRKAQEAALQRR